MGFFYGFIAGSIFGIFVAQNYEVVDIKKLVENACAKASELEKTKQKPQKD